MKVNVLLFGALADRAGISSIVMKDADNTDDLMNQLKRLFAFLENSKYVIARNKVIVRKNTQLSEGDEIAILPPFAGG